LGVSFTKEEENMAFIKGDRGLIYTEDTYGEDDDRPKVDMLVMTHKSLSLGLKRANKNKRPVLSKRKNRKKQNDF
jgi:hypothetical protein